MPESRQGQGRSGGEYKPDSYNAMGTAVKDKAQDLKDKAQELAGSASEIATHAKEKVQGWASTAADKADDARSAVGGSIESLAGKIRQKAPHEGMLGSAAGGIADTMEAAGSYLQDHDFSEMGQEVTNVIRRYPIQSILLGIGLGFLLSRATRS